MKENFEQLKNLAIEYGMPADLVNNIKLSYSRKCNIDNGIMGKYNHFSRSIDLIELEDEFIFSTYIHELIHAIQHQELGTIRYILCLSFLRSRLERDADKLSLHSEKWLKHKLYQSYHK